MYAALAEESLTRLCSNAESTIHAKDSPCLHAHNNISNSELLNNNCFVAKWIVHMCTSFENGVTYEAIVLQWLVQTTSRDFRVLKKWWADALLKVKVKCCCFCAETIVKESPSFELARLNKKKKEKHFGHLVTFRFGTFTMLFHTTRHVVGHEVLKNAWYIVIKGL